MQDNEPFGMLNALWFKPDGGRERYSEYLKAAGPITQRYGGQPSQRLVPQQALIGEFDADLVFVVEWPSFEVFQQFIDDPDYKEIRHLREEAITKSLLIRCKLLS